MKSAREQVEETPASAAGAAPRRSGLARFVGLAPLLAACLWGGMYVVSRASFAAIPPITLGLLRVIIGGLTLWLALRLTARRSGQHALPNRFFEPERARWGQTPSRRDDGATSPQTPPQAPPGTAALQAARPLVAPATVLAPGGAESLVAPTSSSAGVGRAGDQWRFLLLGGTLAATIISQFWGTALASAHDGALLTTITPVFVVPIAWAVLGERPGWRVGGGTALALAGVIIVVAANVGSGGSASSGASLLGDALLLVSALCWALFTVLGAPVVRRRSALVASTYATLWSILLLLPFVPVELAQRPVGAITPTLVLAVLYLGWGATSLAWFLWYKGVERLDAAVAAVFFFAQPLVGGLLSALFLHETLSPGFWLGGLILAGGILLASLQQRGKAGG